MVVPRLPGGRRTIMFADAASAHPLSRRVLLGLPMAFLLPAPQRAVAADVERESMATVEREQRLEPPLTLGIARVVLRPGATALAATPDGARIIVVESGVLAIAAAPRAGQAMSAAELAADTPLPLPGDELFVPAGAAMTFGRLGVASVRNPGARSVVALDVAIYREEPRPLARAFTTDEGISFQLLASANATAAPGGHISMVLERVRLGAHATLPPDLSAGLTLAYVEAGSLELSPLAGEVFAARAAAAAPYSMPGALQPIPISESRGVSAGGVMFLPLGAEAHVANPATRPAGILALAVREAV